MSNAAATAGAAGPSGGIEQRTEGLGHSTPRQVDDIVATYATSEALASSRDALRADSDLLAYGPCHRRAGTAGTPELLPQILMITRPGLGNIRDDYGPAATCRSARDSHESTMGQRCSWRTRTAATPCDGTDDYATAGSWPTRQSGSTGLGEQCKSTRRGMRWVFIILTSRSFFLGESDPSLLSVVWGRADSN